MLLLASSFTALCISSLIAWYKQGGGYISRFILPKYMTPPGSCLWISKTQIQPIQKVLRAADLNRPKGYLPSHVSGNLCSHPSHPFSLQWGSLYHNQGAFFFPSLLFFPTVPLRRGSENMLVVELSCQQGETTAAHWRSVLCCCSPVPSLTFVAKLPELSGGAVITD